MATGVTYLAYLGLSVRGNIAVYFAGILRAFMKGFVLKAETQY